MVHSSCFILPYLIFTVIGGLIRREDYPSYFKPEFSSISDIVVTNCNTESDCSGDEGWLTVDKNLNLGSGNESKLAYKIDSNGTIITDILVSSRSVDGYTYKGNNIYVEYGNSSNEAITGIDVLYGPDAVEVRPDWTLIANPIHGEFRNGMEPKISYRRGSGVDYKLKYPGTVKLKEDGSFKVLQVADLHFSTGYGRCRDPVPESTAEGCQADPRTLNFIEKVLELENPDLVILSGDQVYGPSAPDAETALFKVLRPFIENKIPYAVVLGNHDQESSLNREQSITLSSNLPYSVTQQGPSNIHGFGNYVLAVDDGEGKTAIALYFLDSGDYAESGGYDYLRQDQLDWLKEEVSNITKTDKFLSMGIFHIPIKDFELDGQYVGHQLEKNAYGNAEIDVRSILGDLEINAITIGHDHVNDYCELDVKDSNKLWLCYGGGAGNGGYGNQEEQFQRRLRTYEFQTDSGNLRTWKRLENDTDSVLEDILLVEEGINVFPDLD